MPKLALRLGTDAVQGFFGVTFDARQGGLPPKNDDSSFGKCENMAMIRRRLNGPSGR